MAWDFVVARTSALFVYGTLLFPEILRAVVGRELVPRPAVLEGFARRRLLGEHFPALIEAEVPASGPPEAPEPRVGEGPVPAHPGAVVTGAVYVGLDDADWRRLDAFEGELYERRLVTVRLGGPPSAEDVDPGPGRSGLGGAEATSDAFVYVVPDRWRHRVMAEPWDPEVFARDHLGAFARGLEARSDAD